MQPRPVPTPIKRRNTLTKPPPGAPNALPGAASSYLTTAPTAPPISVAAPTGIMTVPNPQHRAVAQKPYLTAETAMMQEALKIAALKTAETIRYMATVRRVGGASRVKGPPPAVANELRSQLTRYDQLCDIVEARLVRAHAALSTRLARERAGNPQQTMSTTGYAQKVPIVVDSPMSDDIPLSLTTSHPTITPPSSTVKYTPAPKSRGLTSLASQHPSSSAPDAAYTISPVTLASNAAMPSAQDTILSHHAVVPGLLDALRRQEQEQARNALHRPPGQEATMDMLTAAHTMEELFMANTNPGEVDLDITSAVAVIDTANGMGHSVADIDSAVSAMHSAVPDMTSAVAELDSAVAEIAAAGDLDSLDPHTDDPLFADLHANANGDNPRFGTQSAQDSFANDGLQARGFPGESLPANGDPFAAGNIPANDFPNVSGTGEDDKSDLLADLDATGANDMDLQMNMDLMEIGGLGIAANEMGHTGENGPQDGETNLGEGGIGIDGNINLGDVDISGGDININDVGMEMGDEIEAMWSTIGNPLDGFFGGMDSGIGDGIQIKTEED